MAMTPAELVERAEKLTEEASRAFHLGDDFEAEFIHRASTLVPELAGALRLALAENDRLTVALDTAIAVTDAPEKIESLRSLILNEAQAASRILDWIGVASGLSLSQRVRILALQLATTQGYTLEGADRLAPSAFDAFSAGAEKATE
jgi:hypothetical protein